MNREALEKVLPHLHIQTAYPTKVEATVASWFDRRQALSSFTRVNWTTGDISVAEIVFPRETEGEDERAANFMKFLVCTRTRIVKREGQAIPADTEDLNDDDVVLDLKVDFAVEYAVANANPDELPQEGVEEFAAHNMPYHLWPYYRQFAQDMALRFQVPIPAIPSYRVPKSHQPTSTK
ncbi:hypothetical protein J5T34_09075 [Cupriavidus gilardii]|uniref:hypothetical protein n=1 Tax=Cupriavidus gilardii TaxID=82541 RepID=UPI001ABDF06D|nr:hypothetical protein [Cupriavidus gilardii]MBO4120888.1 hypothetical protein [Cupriavidus gilardii]